MKKVNGIWLPDKEIHLAEFSEILEQGTYQFDRVVGSIQYCKKQGKRMLTAIDVGGHVGLWSMHLVKEFQKVHAFEPIEEHRECFFKNVQSPLPFACELHDEALGKRRGKITLLWEDDNTGHTHIDGNGNKEADICLLDDFEFDDVDFIKIDVEGYELFVLEGAEKTIEKYWPVVCIEQKDHGYFVKDRYAALKWLKKKGYKEAAKSHSDYIMIHD